LSWKVWFFWNFANLLSITRYAFMTISTCVYLYTHILYLHLFKLSLFWKCVLPIYLLLCPRSQWTVWACKKRKTTTERYLFTNSSPLSLVLWERPKQLRINCTNCPKAMSHKMFGLLLIHNLLSIIFMPHILRDIS
jgi:hypothetical protein